MSRAIVLSGGASLGAVQVGMLQAHFERRITPDLIVGSQAGAINGAFIASREATAQPAEALGDLWHELHKGVFPSNALSGLLGLMGRSDRLVLQELLRKVIGRHLRVDDLKQRRLRFDVERYSEDARVIVLPPRCPQHVEPIDFSRSDELIDRGLADARAFLKSVERGEPRSGVGSAKRLRPHSH